MRLTRHAKIELIAVVGLFLGSCSGDGPRLYTHDEIEDIASDVATDAIADSPKISELQSRIEQLEQKVGR